MRALTWHGRHDVRVEDVPEPRVVNPRDAVIRVTLTAICGSDLHLYDGFVPTMERGDILGHEFMGEVVEVGPEAKLEVGDRVVVPFPISCGRCDPCKRELYSLCDNSNPNAWMAEEMWGYSPAGLYGYSHLLGGYPGGQAEFVRVPFADVGPIHVPDGLADEQVLLLSDVFPTGYQAALNADIEPGDVVAVWGCGPVGLFAALSARLLGAERVIAIDRIPERLALAREHCHAETIDYREDSVVAELRERTGGRGPDACIDAVGMEAHGLGLTNLYDQAKQAMRLQTDRPTALREALQACGKGGTVSIPGVYAGVVDKLNIGAAFGKGLTLKAGQTHVQRYLPKLLRHVQEGDVDLTFPISHRLPLDEGPEAYRIFQRKEDHCTKVVLAP